MTQEERLEQIELWFDYPTSKAEQLRFAAMQMMEEIPGYTSGDFARDCLELGVLAHSARNRFNEARNNMLESGWVFD